MKYQELEHKNNESAQLVNKGDGSRDEVSEMDAHRHQLDGSYYTYIYLRAITAITAW